MSDRSLSLSEILTHLDEERPSYFNAISPPIIQSSNFAFANTEAFRKAFEDERSYHLYSRGNNPTTAILRAKIAALEGTEDALVFGSGAAAMATAVLTHCEAGGHVICVKNPYSWTRKLIVNVMHRYGVEYTFVDGTDLLAIERAIRPNTQLMVLESPNTMTFELQDLRACASLCKAHGIVSLVDNSYCSPLYQKPATMGIDIVLHSGSKYLNGHSDVVAGVLCGTRTRMNDIFSSGLMTLGAALSPADASLMIRGLRTLELRMQRVFESGLAVARFLEAHPRVERVWHPWLPSFDQHDLSRKQMTGTGGLFSFGLRASGLAEVNQMVDRLRRFLLAVSWGGHESLVMPMSVFHGIPGRENPDYPFNLIRLYVGLEDPQYLIDDLQQALDQV